MTDEATYMLPLTQRQTWILRVAMLSSQQVRHSGVSTAEHADLYTLLSAPPACRQITRQLIEQADPKAFQSLLLAAVDEGCSFFEVES